MYRDRIVLLGTGVKGRPPGKLTVSIVEIVSNQRLDEFGSYSSLVGKGLVEMWSAGERFRRAFTVNLESETFFTIVDCAIASHVVATRGDTVETVNDHQDKEYNHRLKWMVEQEFFRGWVRLFGAHVRQRRREEGKILCCVQPLFFRRNGCIIEPRIWTQPSALLAFSDDLRALGARLQKFATDWEATYPTVQP